jgi:hypothetical protein
MSQETFKQNIDTLNKAVVGTKFWYDPESRLLSIDDRWFQGMRRSVTGDSRTDLYVALTEMHQQLKYQYDMFTYSNYKSFSYCIAEIEHVLHQTYPKYKELHILIDLLLNSVYKEPEEHPEFPGVRKEIGEIVVKYKENKMNLDEDGYPGFFCENIVEGDFEQFKQEEKEKEAGYMSIPYDHLFLFACATSKSPEMIKYLRYKGMMVCSTDGGHIKVTINDVHRLIGLNENLDVEQQTELTQFMDTWSFLPYHSDTHQDLLPEQWREIEKQCLDKYNEAGDDDIFSKFLDKYIPWPIISLFLAIYIHLFMFYLKSVIFSL